MNPQMFASAGKAGLINSNNQINSSFSLMTGASIDFQISEWKINLPLTGPSFGAIINFTIDPWIFNHENTGGNTGGMALFVTDLLIYKYPATSMFSTSNPFFEQEAYRMPFTWNMEENLLTFSGNSVIVEAEMEMNFNNEGPIARRSRVKGQVVIA